MCISPSQLTTLINKEKIEDETLWYELKAKHMVSNGIDDNQIALLSSRYRTKKSFLENFLSSIFLSSPFAVTILASIVRPLVRAASPINLVMI
jgi:hypothetical protein